MNGSKISSVARRLLAVSGVLSGLLLGASLARADYTVYYDEDDEWEPLVITDTQFEEFEEDINCAQHLFLANCYDFVTNCRCDPGFTWTPPRANYIMYPIQ